MSNLNNLISEKRKKSLKFHIDSDDYFGTLASTLYLVKQNMDKHKEIINQDSERLDRIKNELMFLQANYKIATKENSAKNIRGSPKG